MSIATFTIDGREYIVIPKDEYNPPKPRRKKKGQKRSLRSMSAAMSRNWDHIVDKARSNTKRLTGKENL